MYRYSIFWKRSCSRVKLLRQYKYTSAFHYAYPFRVWRTVRIYIHHNALEYGVLQYRRHSTQTYVKLDVHNRKSSPFSGTTQPQYSLYERGVTIRVDNLRERRFCSLFSLLLILVAFLTFLHQSIS
jgi:hypothetical protein